MNAIHMKTCCYRLKTLLDDVWLSNGNNVNYSNIFVYENTEYFI